MKVLLDECVDRRLAPELTGHDVSTVPQMGWAAIRNGELLLLAEKQFDVFLTVDRNLSFQQHLPRFEIVVVVIRASTTGCTIYCRSYPEFLMPCRSQSVGKLRGLAFNRKPAPYVYSPR